MPFYLLLRLSEKAEKEVYQELPLCQIREMYEKLPGGEKFIQELQSSSNLRALCYVVPAFSLIASLFLLRPEGETAPPIQRR